MSTFRTGLAAVLAVLALGAACSEPGLDPGGPSFAKAPTGPKVTATDPNFSVRDTTIDVRVLGSGFDQGSRADFLLGGFPDPKVVTNSTRFVSSSEVVATITIAADAVPDFRDVMITTLGGKKGIGTQKFEVVEPIMIVIPGATDGTAWDVNSSGQLVGRYGVSAPSCTGRAYVWSEAGGAITLPIPDGYCSANADAINEAGVIAGDVQPTAGVAGDRVPARWVPSGPGTWNVEVLPMVPYADFLTEVFRINDNGSIAALWKMNDGTTNAGIWQPGTGWTLLARPAGSTFCTARSINNNEEITGNCHTAGGNSAFYWATPSSAPALLPGPTGGTSGGGRGINNSGVIAGTSTFVVRNRTTSRVTRWTPDGANGWTATDLGLDGTASDINDAGVLVGTSFGAWLPGTGVSPLGPLKQGQTAFVTSVSNAGTSGITWITGYGPTSASSGTFPLVWKR